MQNRAPYTKPALTRYGKVEELTRTGSPGSLMDALQKGTTKTGF